jgi:hypothetical protein
LRSLGKKVERRERQLKSIDKAAIRKVDAMYGLIAGASEKQAEMK